MKKSVLFILLAAVCCGKAGAQSAALIDSALQYNMPALSYPAAVQAKLLQINIANPADTFEGSETNEFSRTAAFNQSHFYSGNAPSDSDAFLPLRKTMNTFITDPDFFCGGSAGGTWQCLGPFNNSYGGYEDQGRVNYVWVDPGDTSHILAGTFGGVWATSNGGLSWHNISDNITIGYGGQRIPGTMGIWDMAVDPADANRIYLFLGTLTGITLGIAYTTDGGANWQMDATINADFNFPFANGALGLSNDLRLEKMAYEPATESLYVYTNFSIYLKPYPSATWQNITPSPGTDTITDMEFSTLHPGHVVFSTAAANGTVHLKTYDGASWVSDVTVDLSTLYSGTITPVHIQSFSLSAADTAFMLIMAHSSASWYQLLCQTPTDALHISGISFSPNLQHLIVSPNNTSVMYATLLYGGSYHNFVQSTDHGLSFSDISGGIYHPTHDDGRFITLYTATTSSGGVNDVLYGGDDGGVVKKRAGHTNVQSITGDSLCITELFGMSNAEGEDDLIIGGAQDNGRLSFNKHRAVPWEQDVLFGDNMMPKFARNGVRSAYTESNAPAMEQVDFLTSTENDNGMNSPTDCSADFWGSCHNFNRPLYADPNNNFYVGYYSVYKKPFSSGTSGAWAPAFNTSPYPEDSAQQVCDEIIGEPDTNDVYIAYRGMATTRDSMKLFHSSNASADPLALHTIWQDITPYGARYWPINDIETDPANSSRLWVAYGGLDWAQFGDDPSIRQFRVDYTTDYFAHHYDVSRGLPPVSINKILYQHGSKDVLYAATDVGVYRCDFSTFNPADPPYYDITWQCFNDGMPACIITDMEFNYCAPSCVSPPWAAAFGSRRLIFPGIFMPPAIPSAPVPASPGTLINTSRMPLLSSPAHPLPSRRIPCTCPAMPPSSCSPAAGSS